MFSWSPSLIQLYAIIPLPKSSGHKLPWVSDLPSSQGDGRTTFLSPSLAPTATHHQDF